MTPISSAALKAAHDLRLPILFSTAKSFTLILLLGGSDEIL